MPKEVFSASLLLNGTKHNLKLPLEALDLLVKLKQHKPQGQSEEWVWLEFFIDKTGNGFASAARCLCLLEIRRARL